MRLLYALLAALALWTPAHALTPSQRSAVLSPSPCAGVAISVNFVGSPAACYNGSRLGLYASIPGWSYSGSVSGTGATVRTATDLSGNIYTFANGVPRITNKGLLVEQAATNSFLNSATGATQTVTTTAASWTLSFYGTGSFAGAGSCTISLSGTGANNRVSQTVTATAGSCVLTDTGSTTDVQFEAGSFATSYIPTASAAITRSADLAKITNPPYATSGTIIVKFFSSPASSTGVIAYSDGTANNRLDIRSNGSFLASAFGTSGGTGSSLGSGTPSYNTSVKIAFSYAPANFALSYNGMAAVTSAGLSIPTKTSVNVLNVGVLEGQTNPLNNYVQYFKVLSGNSASVSALSAGQ